MKKEYKYFATISFLFLASITILATLLRKYATVTFQHFVETCKQVATTFFSSGSHYIGLALLTLALLTALVFCMKTLFSLLKTQKKISKLLICRSDAIPKKLQRVLKNAKVEKDKVIVINRQSYYAFSFGFRVQRIVLSEGLINNLTFKELEAVVLHEQYHIESKHPLLLVLSEIISSTLFFLPMVWGINKKMKVVFENQADAFTISIQGSNQYINSALQKSTNSRILVFPNFARRSSSDISRLRIFGTFVVSIITVFLFLLSTQIDAAQPTFSPTKPKACTESYCAAQCPSSDTNQSIYASLDYQYNLPSTAY